MEGKKNWYESTTIRNNLIGILTTLFTLAASFGFELPIEHGEIVGLYDKIAVIFGAAGVVIFQVRAIIGRIKATKEIG